MSVRIPPDNEKSNLIRIEGDPQGVQQAKKELLELASRMVSRTWCLESPRLRVWAVMFPHNLSWCKCVPLAQWALGSDGKCASLFTCMPVLCQPRANPLWRRKKRKMLTSKVLGSKWVKENIWLSCWILNCVLPSGKWTHQGPNHWAEIPPDHHWAEGWADPGNSGEIPRGKAFQEIRNLGGHLLHV